MCSMGRLGGMHFVGQHLQLPHNGLITALHNWQGVCVTRPHATHCELIFKLLLRGIRNTATASQGHLEKQ